MKSTDLKPHQVIAMQDCVTRDAVYYHRLMRRMEKLKFSSTDPVYQRVVIAAGALGALRVFVEQIGKPAPDTNVPPVGKSS